MHGFEDPESETIERLLRELRISLPVIDAVDSPPPDVNDLDDDTQSDDIGLAERISGYRWRDEQI